MSDSNPDVFKLHCPCCGNVLWIDPASRTVLKTEKVKKKTSSLDELLLKEKKKKDGADQLFASTSALEKKKRAEAQKQFAKVFSELESEE